MQIYQDKGLHNLQLLQLGIDALNGQTHHIVVAAIEARNAYITYPLLNAIGSCLVEGAIGGDVMMDLVISKLLEGDISSGEIILEFVSTTYPIWKL